MDEIAETVARVQLRALVDRYAAAADKRDRAAFVDVFTGDDATVLVGGRERRGRQEIAALLDHIEGYAHTMHFVGNHIIEIDGDAASGVTYCLASHITAGEDEQNGRNTLMAIRYHDDYRRTGQGWRIARRELVIDWRQDLPLSLP